MNIKFYNSLSNSLEDFKTIQDKKVSMYVCGPTVYNYPHIGNTNCNSRLSDGAGRGLDEGECPAA